MDSGNEVKKIFSKGLGGNYKLPTWAAILILAVGLVAFGGHYVFKEYKTYQSRQAEILLAQQEELAVARQEIEALKSGEAASKKAEDILVSQPGSTLANIVKEWRPKVASVECRWEGLFGEVINNGSGLWLSSQNVVITSDHVVIEEGVFVGPPVKADSCSVKLPGGETVTAKTGDISSWPGVEGVATISIKNPPASMKRVVSSLNSVCKSAVPAGERIAVLGYPSIGAENDVTVTEGIISGYEDNFYITSAKIERGVSGGVAVFIDKDCYLGIPTFVRAGEIESLGRILDSRALLK